MKQITNKDTSLLGENLTNTLLEAVLPEVLAPERRLALWARILDSVFKKKQLITVRSQEGEWVTVTPGVSTKLLHRSGTAHSFLVCLAPGAELPAHDHEAEEECLLLEGDAMLGGMHASPGDYQLAPKGTHHKPITTQRGALIFVRYGNPAKQNPTSQ